MSLFMGIVWKDPEPLDILFSPNDASCQRCGAALKSLSANPFEAARGWKSCDWCDRIVYAKTYITTLRVKDLVVASLARMAKSKTETEQQP